MKKLLEQDVVLALMGAIIAVGLHILFMYITNQF